MGYLLQAFVGETGINPNTGVLGTGYMHIGYAGLLVYAIVSGLLLALFESLAKGLPQWVSLAVAGAPMYIMFTSTDLPIALMTNGGIVALLVLFLWPSEQPRTVRRIYQRGAIETTSDTTTVGA